MTEETTPDVLAFNDQGKAKLPSGLNVLTILTFIGCSVFGLFTLLMPVFYKFLLGVMDKAASSGKEFTAKELAEMEKGRAAIELVTNNMVPTMIIGLIGITLCFIGALWMRKYKKDGYWMYVAGELAPLIAGFFVLGTKQYTSIWSYIIGIGIPVLFVILYSTQRKYLIK
jgi:ABC-type phosphate transport system permease subunit